MKIVIIQSMLKLYRVPLYEKLHDVLLKNGHELRVVFGVPVDEHLLRNDNAYVESDCFFYYKSQWFFSNKLHVMWDVVSHILWADIVITEQANKHLHNYFLLFLSIFNIKPFAYWGHGLNRQGNPRSFCERMKKYLVIHVDWWFAYTSSVAAYVNELGFNKDRITVLNNSIDTYSFKKDLAVMSPLAITEFRREYDISDDAQIGLFCGSLHRDKEIHFLLESALLIKDKNPRFTLLIGGDGIDKVLVEQYAKQYDFIKYLGRIDGDKKTFAFKCADVFLNPGMIGLAILDAFSAGLPVFTTRNLKHSPEIDYLQQSYNGMISDYDLDCYAQTILSILALPSQLAYQSKNALASSEQFSIENMALNFSEGIEKFFDDIDVN